jgi:hypothetical protein
MMYEETQVWPLMRDALAPDQLMELGKKMATAKDSAPTRPHPHTLPNPAMQKVVGSISSLIDSVVNNLKGAWPSLGGLLRTTCGGAGPIRLGTQHHVRIRSHLSDRSLSELTACRGISNNCDGDGSRRTAAAVEPLIAS